jgi:transmembrane sensor
MNRSTHVPDPAAEDQAALWAARLEGSILTEADRAALDAWLAGDPARRALLSAYCGFSAKLDWAVPELAAAGSIEMPPVRERPRSAWNPWKLATLGMATAGIALGVFQFERARGRTEDLSTPAGQRGSFTLSDGTRVELNANTSITVDNGRSERRVHLANGEAFFVVSKDKSRPFTVDTPAGSVRVTGTIFNVLTEAASQLDVTVVEGSVQVRPDDAAGSQATNPTLLAAGGVLSSENGTVSVTSKSAADIDDDLAWRQGKIVCKAMPVSVALARFSHFYGRVMTATAGAGARRAGGQYSLANVDEFLDYLHQGIGLTVVRSADGSVRVSLPGEP